MPVVCHPVLDAPPRKPRARDRFYTWPKIAGLVFIGRDAVGAEASQYLIAGTAAVRAPPRFGARTLSLLRAACPIRDKTCPYNSVKPH